MGSLKDVQGEIYTRKVKIQFWGNYLKHTIMCYMRICVCLCVFTCVFL